MVVVGAFSKVFEAVTFRAGAVAFAGPAPASCGLVAAAVGEVAKLMAAVAQMAVAIMPGRRVITIGFSYQSADCEASRQGLTC